MAFKFDADPEHVAAFRAIVAKARKLDESIDENLLTPDEAFEGLQKFIADSKFPAAPEHVKKLQARAKVVEDKEAKATKDTEVRYPDLTAAQKKLEAAKADLLKVNADPKSTAEQKAVAEKAVVDAQRAVNAFTTYADTESTDKTAAAKAERENDDLYKRETARAMK